MNKNIKSLNVGQLIFMCLKKKKIIIISQRRHTNLKTDNNCVLKFTPRSVLWSWWNLEAKHTAIVCKGQKATSEVYRSILQILF